MCDSGPMAAVRLTASRPHRPHTRQYESPTMRWSRILQDRISPFLPGGVDSFCPNTPRLSLSLYKICSGVDLSSSSCTCPNVRHVSQADNSGPFGVFLQQVCVQVPQAS